jgi:hypothetical protein
MATLYVGLGDMNQAYNWLEKAYQERSGGLVWLRVDPRLDPLRQDPRFTQTIGHNLTAQTARPLKVSGLCLSDSGRGQWLRTTDLTVPNEEGFENLTN